MGFTRSVRITYICISDSSSPSLQLTIASRDHFIDGRIPILMFSLPSPVQDGSQGWADALARAKEFVSQLTIEEKGQRSLWNSTIPPTSTTSALSHPWLLETKIYTHLKDAHPNLYDPSYSQSHDRLRCERQMYESNRYHSSIGIQQSHLSSRLAIRC